jgi:hypothetical protein
MLPFARIQYPVAGGLLAPGALQHIEKAGKFILNSTAAMFCLAIVRQRGWRIAA